MIRRTASARRLAAALLLAPVVAGCAGTDTVSAPAASTAATPASDATPTPAPVGTVIEASYRGGEITGVESRVAVPLGEPIVLRVTSDVAEQIHVHGYDLYVDLVPGTPAELSFTADKPGAYEVELHEARRPLFQLRVS